MSPTDTAAQALHNIKQAFEDFIAHDAERAIAEATRDAERDERLWVVFYPDGRYGTEHVETSRGIHPETVAGAHETGWHVAFPIEPLAPDAIDANDPENSRFDEAIESLWRAYDTAIHQQINV